jgi:hypothetical protein
MQLQLLLLLALPVCLLQLNAARQPLHSRSRLNLQPLGIKLSTQQFVQVSHCLKRRQLRNSSTVLVLAAGTAAAGGMVSAC